MLQNLKQLEEEEPLLHIVWNERLGEIHAQLMGEVQTEILKSMIAERFGVRVEFGAGNIVYKETIRNTVEGVGHFEPLRHYAEVHLLLEPGEPGSGMHFLSNCSEDVLDKNWQRLILTHLEEKEHLGVLSGSPVTDMQITLVSGRAHQKHPEGGDFRQATYRAVRQGLKKAESVLLEPYYEYRLEVPSEMVGRALSDLQRMNGTFGSPEQIGEMAVLSGEAPVALMQDYQRKVISYTKGRGRLSCSLSGYKPCSNAEEVLTAVSYTHLFSCCTVADRACALFPGNLYETFCNDRTCHGCSEKIFVLINSSGFYARNNVIVTEFIDDIFDVQFGSTGKFCTFFQSV